MSDLENKHSFSIKFEKDAHSLNVDTYAKALTAINTLIKEVGYQTNPTGNELAVSVESEKPGSFDVVLAVAEINPSDTAALITAGLSVLGSIVTLVVELIKLKEALSKCDESKTIIQNDTVTLNDSNNNIVFQTNSKTYNIYLGNQTVNDALAAQFQAIKNDEEINAVTYKNENDSFTIKRESFDCLAKKHNAKVEDSKVTTMSTILVVSKLVLDDSRKKWQFVHQGTRISATIDDEDFWRKILRGEELFANGDRLVCDLMIVRDYDEMLGAYIDKEYIVKNVREHQKKEAYEQLEL